MNLPGSLGASTLKADLPQAVFTDFSSLNALRNGAESGSVGKDGEDSQLESAAKQFSSIFLHMALKSMREASFGGGILDSQQSEFYRDMFDQQIALDLSEGEGFGLTQVIVDQLSGGANSLPVSTSPTIAAQAYSQVALATQEVEESADNLSSEQLYISTASDVVSDMISDTVAPAVVDRVGDRAGGRIESHLSSRSNFR